MRILIACLIVCAFSVSGYAEDESLVDTTVVFDINADVTATGYITVAAGPVEYKVIVKLKFNSVTDTELADIIKRLSKDIGKACDFELDIERIY